MIYEIPVAGVQVGGFVLIVLVSKKKSLFQIESDRTKEDLKVSADVHLKRKPQNMIKPPKGELQFWCESKKPEFQSLLVGNDFSAAIVTRQQLIREHCTMDNLHRRPANDPCIA
jgi:hypothetical protein